MKSPQYRTMFFLISLISIIIAYFIINPQLVKFYFLFPVLSVVIIIYSILLSGVFNFIEKYSSKKYWEIRPDRELNTPLSKAWNFLISFFLLLSFNFSISIISMFFLYQLEFLSKDSSLLIVVSATVVILIRFLAYYNNEIAKEIGKGFRYAMFPLGFTLFLWEFLVPLTKESLLQSIYNFILNNITTISVLGFVLITITSFDPLFELIKKIRDNFNKYI